MASCAPPPSLPPLYFCNILRMYALQTQGSGAGAVVWTWQTQGAVVAAPSLSSPPSPPLLFVGSSDGLLYPTPSVETGFVY